MHYFVCLNNVNGVWKVFYGNVFLAYINNILLKYREKSIRVTNHIV